MADGLIGSILPVTLNVDQENKTGHELATTHSPRAAERTVRDLPWKQWIVTMDLAWVSTFNVYLINIFRQISLLIQQLLQFLTVRI